MGLVLLHYAHEAEAVCWVMLWLGAQDKDDRSVGHSFEGLSKCIQRRRCSAECWRKWGSNQEMNWEL